MFYDGPDDQGVTWRSPGEYMPWDYGAGPLGYGESYLQTILSYGSDPNQKPPTAYFRRTLAVDRARVAALELNVMYDDGFVYYINGVEGGRTSMPAGDISFSTRAFDHEAENKYASFDITSQISRFTDDYGLLAFEVHQASRSSSDLVFDAELVAWMNGPLDVTTSDDITWEYMLATSNNTALDAIHFVDTMHGWAVGWGGSILNTVDGGVTWNIQRVAEHDENYYSSPEPHFSDVHFANAQTGWAPGATMGVNGLFRTTSGGI